jgi:hypothetical protein
MKWIPERRSDLLGVTQPICVRAEVSRSLDFRAPSPQPGSHAQIWHPTSRATGSSSGPPKNRFLHVTPVHSLNHTQQHMDASSSGPLLARLLSSDHFIDIWFSVIEEFCYHLAALWHTDTDPETLLNLAGHVFLSLSRWK